MIGAAGPGMLAGLRVVEVADELGEYCGLLFAGLGADVIKVEPPEGSPTRAIGPFLDDYPDPERSIFFWHYNRNKRSVALDAKTDEGREQLLHLIEGADVLIDSSCGELNAWLGLDRDALIRRFPGLVVARMTPFGDDGPWAKFKGSDLIHLALGGVMMNCGYDPDPRLRYDLPPIAPQLWHAYHIAGEQLAVGAVAALLHRLRTGEGQDVSCAVHEAVSKNTELDLMSWVMRRAPLYRLTCRHAMEQPNHTPNVAHTKDGRWYISWGVGARDEAKLVPFLDRYNMCADLEPPENDADLQRPQRARIVGEQRAPGPHSRGHPAIRSRIPIRHDALARSSGGRPALGPLAQAARERARRALASAPQLRRRRSPGAWPIVALLHQQMAVDRDKLAGRPEGADAWRTHRGRARRAAARAQGVGRRRARRDPRCSRRTASLFRFRTCESSISPGSSLPPGARGFSRRWAPRA